MSEKNDEKNGSVIKDTIDAVTGLAKAVPIYDDAFQPLAKETGKAFGTVGKLVNVALSPLAGLVWGYEQLQVFLERTVSEKLQNIPKERIVTPKLNVLVPAVEALRYTHEETELQDLFANLIANAMDSETLPEAHPSFVDIIKNMTSDEALIMKIFATKSALPLLDVQVHSAKNKGYKTVIKNDSEIGMLAHCVHTDLVETYIDNLCRLGLLEIPSGVILADDDLYKELEQEIEIDLSSFENDDIVKHKHKKIQITSMGRSFLKICVIDKK